MTRYKPHAEPEYFGFAIISFIIILSFAYLEQLGTSLFLCVGSAFLLVEKIFPDLELPPVRHWYARALVLNTIQWALSQLGSATWEKGAMRWVMFDLGRLTPFVGGVFAYLLVTFVFYWWHRWRHESEFLWVAFHQVN